jgi:hypothetical protein
MGWLQNVPILRRRSRSATLFVMRELRVVAVEELPGPWNPFNCLYHERFELLSVHLGAGAYRERAETFARMVNELTQAERDRCPYHVTNWSLASEVAIRCWQRCLPPGNERFADLVRRAGEGPNEIDAAQSFFFFPLSWQPGEATVGNGQHRICALKCSSASRCLVER